MSADTVQLAALLLAINSSTDATFTPGSLAGGSTTFKVSSLLEISTPKSEAFNFSSGFFLAFITLGNDTYLGSFNRKSVVMIIGNLALKVSEPPSISLVTVTWSPSTSTFEAFVAWGQFKSPANICPVWLASSSMACFPKMTKLLSCFSTTFCNILATFKGSISSSPTSTKDTVSAPFASAVLKTSCAFVGPIETACISSTKSLLFSASLKDSSKAISQNGFMLNFTPLVSTPV